MSLSTIPARNDLPNYKFRITLNDVIFTLSLHYNTRMDNWIMDISDASGNQILGGIPVLINRNLTWQYLHLEIPKGLLFTTDDTGQGTQPTTYSFGTTHTLWYDDLVA